MAQDEIVNVDSVNETKEKPMVQQQWDRYLVETRKNAYDIYTIVNIEFGGFTGGTAETDHNTLFIVQPTYAG